MKGRNEVGGATFLVFGRTLWFGAGGKDGPGIAEVIERIVPW